MDESGLIEAFVRGDPEALGIVDGWIEAAIREDFRALQGEWDDLRQEVRICVFRNLSDGRFEGRSSLRTYVHRVARNVAIDATRRAYRRHEAPSHPGNQHVSRADKGNVVDEIVARDLVRKVLESLPEGDRLLVLLVLREHRSYAEVARRLGTTEGAVKVRMSRCKDRIIKILDRLNRQEGARGR